MRSKRVGVFVDLCAMLRVMVLQRGGIRLSLTKSIGIACYDRGRDMFAGLERACGGTYCSRLGRAIVAPGQFFGRPGDAMGGAA